MVLCAENVEKHRMLTQTLLDELRVILLKRGYPKGGFALGANADFEKCFWRG